MTKARDIASAAPAPSTVSATEIGYLDGVTSAIQTQIDGKASTTADIPKSLIDAKGDLIVGSANDTAARLAVGTNDYVLTADSAATNGVKWAAVSAGGMTELASGSIAASATGFDLTSISGSYNELWLYIANLSADATGGIGYNSAITFNNDTGSNYSLTGTLDGTVRNINNSAVGISLFATETAGTRFSCVVRIPNYTDTTSTKVLSFVGQNYPDKFVNSGAGIWTATPAAINRITLKIGGGAYDGGTYKLYGVK